MHPLRKLGALLAEGQMYNTFGGFLGPFKVGHTYVDDAKGRTVADCPDKETAKIIADLLNKTYPKKSKD